ncbi:serine kinase of the HPr protein, regulates carbohydrate metabolism [Terriglobus roseus DSM 18391]|uniref:Serine kinase of the HPr protein, regulates carbohydrate metabolism n=1 Tax=Terriglobus roseus (strain DSM 18391 / NRRL B-41598 / KBS 63) TaxID=926566 RepID=I3ZK31_TERRK|nr:serine kinase of the HPr protein, regulates carbohydrate metabolism [Terriglobus roseus DSM 18391]
MRVPENPARTVRATPVTTYNYVMSGLSVRSDVEMPSAILAEASGGGEPDVTITIGEVPAHLAAATRVGGDWEFAPGEFLLRLRDLMKVYVTGGSSILLEPAATCDPGDLTLYLLGTCFAILLQQRGRVVLHASAVAVGDRAMLFCGASGMGKSTMAAMLSERGYPLLNDDVCNLSPDADDRYSVYPDGRMLKLWSGSVDHLRWTATEDARIRHDAEKFYMAPASVDLKPRIVGGVYMLHAAEAGATATVEPLNAAESMSLLTVNAYRPALVKAMQMVPTYFAASAALQRHAGVFRLSRPMDFSRAAESLDVLEAHWAGIR